MLTTMKRIYQAPELTITKMQMQTPLLLATSETTVEGSNGGWVKGDRSAGRGERQDYNVWNDDWSQ